jgi:hypothetical protein
LLAIEACVATFFKQCLMICNEVIATIYEGAGMVCKTLL